MSHYKNSHGKVFEKEFFNSFPDNLFIQRLKDDTLKFKNVYNCCDFIGYSFPYLFLFELKTTKQRSLPFNNISKHQIDTLYRYSKLEGVKAGFVLNFRTYSYQTFFLDAEKAHDYYYHADRKSFPLEWVKEHGIYLSCSLIRTRYRFDLIPIINTHPL